MAKKKRRYGKKKQPTVRRTFDAHHLCWQKKQLNKRAITRALREYPYCIIEIPKNTLHKYIHRKVLLVPLPDDDSAIRALNKIQALESRGEISLNDGIEKRLRILIALFEPTDKPTSEAFEKQLQVAREFKKAPE